VLISCISSCEADFEETNSTLKYANRACRIKNSPLPNKQLLLEEDLLPLLPANATASGNMSMMQMQVSGEAWFLGPSRVSVLPGPVVLHIVTCLVLHLCSINMPLMQT
jgi:hypothetical protein